MVDMEGSQSVMLVLKLETALPATTPAPAATPVPAVEGQPAAIPVPTATPVPTPTTVIIGGTPTPTPTPVATTAAPAPAPAPPPAENWIDRPRTPGDWSYRAESDGGIALYGESASETRFSIDCDRGANQVTLTRAGQVQGQASMTIRTETTDRALATRASGSGQPTVVADIPARDPLLDAMAITRGRFAVEVPGLSTVYLPPWAEVTRVIEECR